MPKLTKRLVDAIVPDPAGRQVIVWDDQVKGFGFRVTALGAKSYVLNYRNAEGRERRYTIGRHGSPWTCEQARLKAIELLRDIAAGIDPMQVKAEARTAMTVRQLCERYLADADRGLILGKGRKPKKPSTLATDRGRIARHIVPLLGHRVVKELVQADITRFMRDVIAGKTAAVIKTGPRGKAVVEGGAGTATRTVGLLSGILTYAVSEGIIPANPAHGVRRPADRRRDVRLGPEDYRKLGAALAAADAEGENLMAVVGVWLLALTGCRRGEIEALRWPEVDEAGRCLRLADSKEGASVRPIGSAVLAVLSRLGRQADSEFVLTGRGGVGCYAALSAGLERIVARAELSSHVTAHTLRHSFSSVANDLGFTEPTIAAMLGHAVRSVTGRYVHHLDSALIAAADRVARTIQTYMTGAVDKVVPLPTAESRKR